MTGVQTCALPICLSNMKDIDALCAAEDDGVMGVIAGRAIYTGDLDLAKAQQHADKKSNKS